MIHIHTYTLIYINEFKYGNNNNLIGLSLTLSRLPHDFSFCVLELGMNNIGEIRELTKIAKPNIAVITNVSNSHIQNFKNEKITL